MYKINFALIDPTTITSSIRGIRTLRCSGVGGGTPELYLTSTVTPKHYGINIKQHASRSCLCKHTEVLYSYALPTWSMYLRQERY